MLLLFHLAYTTLRMAQIGEFLSACHKTRGREERQRGSYGVPFWPCSQAVLAPNSSLQLSTHTRHSQQPTGQLQPQTLPQDQRWKKILLGKNSRLLPHQTLSLKCCQQSLAQHEEFSATGKHHRHTEIKVQVSAAGFTVIFSGANEDVLFRR